MTSYLRNSRVRFLQSAIHQWRGFPRPDGAPLGIDLHHLAAGQGIRRGYLPGVDDVPRRCP